MWDPPNEFADDMSDPSLALNAADEEDLDTKLLTSKSI